MESGHSSYSSFSISFFAIAMGAALEAVLGKRNAGLVIQTSEHLPFWYVLVSVLVCYTIFWDR